jgi:hypothetical protein
MTRTTWRILLLGPVGLLLAAAAEARAANLDEALLKAAPGILSFVKEEGYTNIGVLPFKVQKGSRKASFGAAPLAANLPGRLENVLIMSQGSDEDEAVGIIRDAGGTAQKAKVGRYGSSDAAFRKLFAARYKLAWGKQKVKADAFLTGLVVNTHDRSRTKIQVQLITPKSRAGGELKATDVGKPIDVRTDRSLLRDLGYTYALSRSVLRRGYTAQKRDAAAVRLVARGEQGQQGNEESQSDLLTPDNIAGMAFELRYNGEKQELKLIREGKPGARAAQYQAPPAEAGTKLTMVLTRLLGEDKPLGVVLKVNGRSTFQEEELESIKCRKWIYAPDRKDKADEFLGFYSDAGGKNVRRFRVADEKESAQRASELGPRAGWIDIDVYASEEEKKDGGDEPEAKISSRGMARSRGTPATLKQAQARLRKANNVKVKPSKVARRGPGGLILPEMEASEEVKLDTAELPNPVHLGGISIRYYEPGTGGEEDE